MSMLSRRQDGNADSHNDFDPDDPNRPHYIEQAVSVYLRLDDAGLKWIVDAATVDGYSLYSTYDDESAKNEECGCGRPDECESVRQAADQLPLPTAAELIQLLIDASPPPQP